jgi:hypothetical protein
MTDCYTDAAGRAVSIILNIKQSADTVCSKEVSIIDIRLCRRRRGSQHGSKYRAENCADPAGRVASLIQNIWQSAIQIQQVG